MYYCSVKFKKFKQKACIKQQIMCDYDDSLFTRGSLGSHLGSSSDWDRLTSVTNELDSMKRTTTTFSLLYARRWRGRAMNTREHGRVRKASSCTRPLLNNTVQPVVCFSVFRCGLSRFVFKVAIISHLRWHPLSDEGEVKSLRWLIIISKVPCHAADLNKRVWGEHLHAFLCLG